jgi:dolichol-phosphate mannosyltransferase
MFTPSHPALSLTAPHELLVVMPVYNEQECIAVVLDEWMQALDAAGVSHLILAIDDGSTDSTPDVLQDIGKSSSGRLEIISRPNRGHGQTCLEGYRHAIARHIPFILQIDSDGQSSPAHFHDFWRLRHDFDVIYGKRNRSDGFRRILASGILRVSLRILAGVDCIDANVPYRLMNTPACSAAILGIPVSIHLANIALAVQLRRNPSIRHGAVPISFPPRLGGEPSVPFSKFASKALELFRQLPSLPKRSNPRSSHSTNSP